TWDPAANVAVSGFVVKRGGTQIGAVGAAESSYTDASIPAPGTYLYEVSVLTGGSPACFASCRATVTGVPIGSAGACDGVLNTYNFNGDLKSSTCGRDLIARVSPPLDPATDVPGG